jgi:hypothetical protein
MDFALLATSFLALVGPYVTTAAGAPFDIAAKKISESAAVDLYQSIRGLLAFKPEAKSAVTKFEANEPGAQQALTAELARVLESNPDIRELVRSIVDQQSAPCTVDQSTVTMNFGDIALKKGVLTNINRAETVQINPPAKN